MFAEHLPILQVILPLMAAPICLIVRRSTFAWLIALLASTLSFAISLSLLTQVYSSGPISYLLGNWAAPWGIEYVVDLVSAFVLVVVSGIGTAVLLYAQESVTKEIRSDRIYLFYTMYLLCLSGLLGIAITGDIFNLFVFLEVSALSTYVLISLGQDKRALTAAYNYLIMGTVGATFYIIGVGMIYVMTGSLNMADLALILPTLSDTTTILAAFAFITIGICLKLALFPLHFWLPNAYTFAPSVVTAFLAATATKVAVYSLIRLYFTVFGQTGLLQDLPVANILMVFAVIAMFAGSAVAIFQKNLKRMLAYSSLAQIGYMILGISLITAAGLSGGLIHIFNHAIMKCALFLVMGCVFYRVGSVKIDDFAGLGKEMPLTMAAFVVAGLSIIGVPSTVGFISKWVLITAVLNEGLWPIAVLILASSLLAVFYIWRIVEQAYFKPAPEGRPAVIEAPISMLIPMWGMAGASIYFGINGNMTVRLSNYAANLLMNGVAQ